MDELLEAALAEGGDASDSQESPSSSRQRAHTVALDDSHSSSLQISIVDYKIDESKMLYTIHTKTTLPQFSKQDCVVKRRFEDFEWLHARLCENQDICGVLVPHLPPKMVLRKFETLPGYPSQEELAFNATLQRRSGQLERFLHRLALIPVLCDDVNFQVFLEYADELNPRKPSIMEGFFSFKMAPSTKNDPNPEFEKLREFNNTYLTRCSNASASCKRVVEVTKALAEHEGELAAIFKEIKSSNSNASNLKLMSLYDVFAAGLLQDEDVTYTIAHNFEIAAGELLADYVGQCNAIKDLHDRRLHLLKNTAAAATALEKAKAKASAANAPEAAREQEKHAQEACDAAQVLFENTSERALKELSKAKQQRVGDFRKVLVTFAETQIALAKQLHEQWGTTLTALKSLELNPPTSA